MPFCGDQFMTKPMPATSDEVFVFPLSFAQQRLWFLHQMDPSNAAYNMPLAFRLSGQLDVDALQWSLDEIIRRHEILRTTFDVLDQEPVQLVAATGSLTLSVTDFSSLPPPVSESEAEMLATEETQRPFDLVSGPLIRARLMRLKANEQVLLVTMHHIISDGWSQTVLLNELGALYESAVAGRISPLPGLSIQYADFAEWQRQWLQGEVLDQQLDYWRKHLSGAPPSLELPADRPRPAVQSFNGERYSFSLSRDLTARLLELSRREDATPFMTLLAPFYVLLYRYTGQADIVVGTPVANRNRQELESLIGFFVNTLALRVDLSGNPTFRELLARVREVALGAYAHQDLPFEMLVEELSPARDASRNPIFQVMFALQNTPDPAARQLELNISPVEVKTARAQFDLMLDVTADDGQFYVTLVYNTDLFDALTIQQTAERFKVLLAGVVHGAGRRISTLPLLTAPELRRLLVEWNDAGKELVDDVRIHRLFEQQVERTPEAVALVFEERRVTYEELNQQANKLAHYLLAAGVGPESFVGLMLERSPEMIVALLAILKAGGVYVPHDPAAPPARLSYMLDDARISVLVTDRRLATCLPLSRNVRVICIDDDIAEHSDCNPPCWTSSDNAAYVIYTSGSTGAPKGVVLAHKSVCNQIAAMAQSFDIGPESCVLQFASLGFDASVFEIFTALTTGARLCLVSRETMLSGGRLVEYAQKQNVTVAMLPPSLLALLAPEEWPELKTAISAGERCPAEIAARWSRGRRFFNAYGPTETTIVVTVYEHDRVRTSDTPIGRPVGHAQLYLLDQYLNPVPIGATGELHIGGGTVGRGYLNRPGLTAEKFIPNPFSTEPGARLYKSGDLAAYLPDGNIRFLGRRDEQLKVRGFRIEPGEIEATLKEHPAVTDAAVVADEDQRLVAYITGTTVTDEELRVLVRQRLPDYMVPSFFVSLAELPLTPNGKVDRIGLRARIRTRLERVAERIGPRDSLEAELARIWEELLHVEPDVRDNFFDLGGHSLLVISLLSRVERVTTKRLHVVDIFQAPTIESLALLLRDGANRSVPEPLVAIQPHGSLTPVFFVHPAGGSVGSYFSLARALGSDRPFYALEGTLAGSTRQVELVAKSYVDAIRAVQPDGPYILGGWSSGGVVAFEMARQLQACGAEVALVVLLDSMPPVTLAAADRVSLLAGFAGNLSIPVDSVSEELLRSDTETQLDWLLDQAHRSQVLPPDLGLDDLRRQFELYLADIEAVRNYLPLTASFPLLLLRAADEDEVAEHIARWTRLSSNKLEVHKVSGDHITMMRAPHIATLAEVLRKRLNQIETSR